MQDKGKGNRHARSYHRIEERQKFGYFSATPSIYYIEKGEVKDSLCSDKEKVNLENYKKFLIENGIIEEE